MKRLRNLFLHHPQSVNETYWQHFRNASSFAIQVFVAAIAGIIHAALPFFFEKTLSQTIKKMHQRLSERFITTEYHHAEGEAVETEELV